jgi:hypothetical protein
MANLEAAIMSDLRLAPTAQYEPHQFPSLDIEPEIDLAPVRRKRDFGFVAGGHYFPPRMAKSEPVTFEILNEKYHALWPSEIDELRVSNLPAVQGRTYCHNCNMLVSLDDIEHTKVEPLRPQQEAQLQIFEQGSLRRRLVRDSANADDIRNSKSEINPGDILGHMVNCTDKHEDQQSQNSADVSPPVSRRHNIHKFPDLPSHNLRRPTQPRVSDDSGDEAELHELAAANSHERFIPMEEKSSDRNASFHELPYELPELKMPRMSFGDLFEGWDGRCSRLHLSLRDQLTS